MNEAIMSQTLVLRWKWPRSRSIHVKVATLRDGWIVGGWIYVLDQLHGLRCFCMDSDWWNSASHMGRLDELLEDGLELDELEEQLGE